MKVSLIVATLNRNENLRRFLENIKAQTYQNFEVIIMDQSDEEYRNQNLRTIKDLGFDNCKVLHIHQQKRGLSLARNEGIKFCKGNVVGFPDDDCWYSERLLENMLDLFSMYKKEGYSFISGCYTEPGINNPRFSESDHKLTLRGRMTDFSSVTLFFDMDIIRKHEFMFDESLGAGAKFAIAEEQDFVLQFLMKGYVGMYLPSLIVFHRIGKGENSFFLLNGTANAYIYSKYFGQNFIMTVKPIVTTVVLGLKGLYSRSSRKLFLDRMKFWLS